MSQLIDLRVVLAVASFHNWNHRPVVHRQHFGHLSFPRLWITLWKTVLSDVVRWGLRRTSSAFIVCVALAEGGSGLLAKWDW